MITVKRLKAVLAELPDETEVLVMRESAPGWWEILNTKLTKDGKKLLLQYETLVDVVRDTIGIGVHP